jgi:hypothetical protein
VTRKSLLLFAATSVIWGSSFLFIRVAVKHIPPAVVVLAGPRSAWRSWCRWPLRRRAFRDALLTLEHASDDELHAAGSQQRWGKRRAPSRARRDSDRR